MTFTSDNHYLLLDALGAVYRRGDYSASQSYAGYFDLQTGYLQLASVQLVGSDQHYLAELQLMSSPV
jgi:hypothetical protein